MELVGQCVDDAVITRHGFWLPDGTQCHLLDVKCVQDADSAGIVITVRMGDDHVIDNATAGYAQLVEQVFDFLADGRRQ